MTDKLWDFIQKLTQDYEKAVALACTLRDVVRQIDPYRGELIADAISHARYEKAIWVALDPHFRDRCPNCFKQMGMFSHGVCGECGEKCGCSWNPCSMSDYCLFHRPLSMAQTDRLPKAITTTFEG
jgi:hypothetical protein